MTSEVHAPAASSASKPPCPKGVSREDEGTDADDDGLEAVFTGMLLRDAV